MGVRNVLGIFSKVFAGSAPATERREFGSNPEADPAFGDDFEQGWPTVYSTPGSGAEPRRKEYNDLFAKLTAIGVDINKLGCCLPWDENIQYEAEAFVVYQGDLYQAITTPTAAVWVPAEWQAMLSTKVVSSLPASDLDGNMYYLTGNVGLYPQGVYFYGQSGWMCIAQAASLSVNWSGIENNQYIAGARYTVTIDADVTTLDITLSNNGDCYFTLSNLGAYTIADPASGYKRSIDGLNSLSASFTELLVSRTDSGNIFSAIQLVTV